MVNRKTFRCILSVLLICFIVALSACAGGGNSSTEKPIKKPTTSSETLLSDDAADDTSSGDSEKTEESTFFDKLLGIFSFTQKNNQGRADADEIRVTEYNTHYYQNVNAGDILRFILGDNNN